MFFKVLVKNLDGEIVDIERVGKEFYDNVKSTGVRPIVGEFIELIPMDLSNYNLSSYIYRIKHITWSSRIEIILDPLLPEDYQNFKSDSND